MPGGGGILTIPGGGGILFVLTIPGGGGMFPPGGMGMFAFNTGLSSAILT